MNFYPTGYIKVFPFGCKIISDTSIKLDFLKYILIFNTFVIY